MKILQFIFLIALVTTLSCKEEMVVPPVDTPIDITRLEINFNPVENTNQPIFVKIEESFRITIYIVDEGSIVWSDMSLKVNNDDDLKCFLTIPDNPVTSEMNYNFIYNPLRSLRLVNDDLYTLEVGDQLHFHFSFTDDTENITEKYFIVEIE